MRTSSWKRTVGSQPSFSFAFDAVAEQQVDLGGTEVALVDLDVVVPVEAGVAECLVEELPTECVSPVAST